MNLSINKIYDGPCSLVFEAWTKPEIIKKWFSPDGQWTVEIANMDVSVGGQYSINMLSPDKSKKWHVYGKYNEIINNKKLVFTWNTPDVNNTLVTVNFKDLGNKTEVSLFHDLLPTQEQVDEHTYGWKGCMNQLSKNVLI